MAVKTLAIIIDPYWDEYAICSKEITPKGTVYTVLYKADKSEGIEAETPPSPPTYLDSHLITQCETPIEIKYVQYGNSSWPWPGSAITLLDIRAVMGIENRFRKLLDELLM